MSGEVRRGGEDRELKLWFWRMFGSRDLEIEVDSELRFGLAELAEPSEGVSK